MCERRSGTAWCRIERGYWSRRRAVREEGGANGDVGAVGELCEKREELLEQ